MMNIVQMQEKLKDFSMDQLVREMQAPSGNAPPYLILSEITRRKQMESSAAGQQAPQTSVAEDAVAAAGVPQGGIADMARALAPQTDMAQNTGVQAMARGGPVKKMAEGDAVRVDEATRIMANRQGMSIDEYLRSVGPERAAAIIADAERRAANQVTSVPNAFNENLPIRGTQAGSDEFHSTFGQVKDEALLELGVNPTRSLGGANQYDQGMPELLTAEETFRQENPFSYPVSAIPASDFRPQPEMPSIFEEIGGTIGEITQNYRDAQRRASQQNDLRAQGSDNRPLTAAEQAVADRRAEIFGGIGDLATRAGQAIDRNVITPAATIAQGTRALIAGGVGDAATLVPGLEGFAVTMQDREDAGMKEVARLAREGVFPGTPTPPAAPADVQKAEDTNKLDALRTIRETDEKTGVPTAPAAPSAPATPAGDGTGGTGGTSGGGGGGGGGAGGVSSYEQQLMDALASREKAATQDKWLALAQVGLNMMSSTNPTLLGAVGEAGLKGVEAARSARDQYDKDKLELQGAIEQSRMARAAAAARSAAGAGRKAIPEGVLDIYDTEIEALSAAASDPTAEPAQKLEAAKRLEAATARRDQLVNIYFSQFGIDTSGASPATSSGVVFEDVPS